ncbi:MAG: hypothetical protein R3F29_05510 [Planctomycetota bacterium]
MPLITHRIGAEACLSRQASHFHKCHKCIYRGQAANWEPEGGALLEMPAIEDPNRGGVKKVFIPRPAAAAEEATPAKGKQKRAAAGG